MEPQRPWQSQGTFFSSSKIGWIVLAAVVIAAGLGATLGHGHVIY